MNSLRLICFLILAISMVIACERKPEDLEVWRNAQGGMEKITDWAVSPSEPMPVRVRAVEIMVEEHHASRLGQLFERIENESDRHQIIAGVVGKLEAMWAQKDFPSEEEVREQGGQLSVGKSEAIAAVEISYFLHPFAAAPEQARMEAIMGEWVSEEQDLRNQLGNATTVGQVISRAGENGIEAAIEWIKTAESAARVARMVLEDADDELRARVAQTVNERAMAEHPVTGDLEVAVLEVNHPDVVPYLEHAITSPDSPARLIDGAMDAYVRILEERSTPLFTRLVREETGLIRWVSATRLIEVRGKAGVLAAANALPLEADSYLAPNQKNLEEESKTFCNFVDTEMREQNVTSIDDILKRGLASDRWPVQVLSLRCAQITKASGVKEEVEALRASRTQVPGWNDEGITIGALATEVASSL